MEKILKTTKKKIEPLSRVLICRTDNLGDVVLTLPMAGWIKKHWPDCEVHFLGKPYTRPLIEACRHIDKFWDIQSVDAEQLAAIQAAILVFPEPAAAKLVYCADIPIRIGTAHRLTNWLYANCLVSFSRRKSPLHESQLNFKLFAGLGLPQDVSLEQIPDLYGLTTKKQDFGLDFGRVHLIFHTKSLGSAKDWPLDYYLSLAKSLDPERFVIHLTGTAKEGEAIKSQCPDLLELRHVYDQTGRFTLAELMSFIATCDGLLACSTGPLHIAAALAKPVWGLFSPVRPIHPGRWAPLGQNATVLVHQPCGHRSVRRCDCLLRITPKHVKSRILEVFADK